MIMAHTLVFLAATFVAISLKITLTVPLAETESVFLQHGNE